MSKGLLDTISENKVHANYKDIPKDIFYQKYIIEKKSHKTIANELKCGYSTALRYLKKHNISMRKKGNKKGYTPWNKGEKGLQIGWNKGRHLSKQHKRKISIARKGKKLSKRSIENIRKGIKKRKDWNKGLTKKTSKKIKEISKKISETRKRLFKEGKLKIWSKGKKCSQLSGQNHPMYGKKCPHLSELHKNPEFQRKRLMACRKKPNKIEKILIEFLNKNFPKKWKYIGDGSVIIGNRNPDFINCNGKKLIIDLWGDYWHSKKSNKKSSEDYFDEEKRKQIFKKYGFDTLIIWEHELKNMNNVLNKIKQFDGGNING